jgi:hypothetical protein
MVEQNGKTPFEEGVLRKGVEDNKSSLGIMSRD